MDQLSVLYSNNDPLDDMHNQDEGNIIYWFESFEFAAKVLGWSEIHMVRLLT